MYSQPWGTPVQTTTRPSPPKYFRGNPTSTNTANSTPTTQAITRYRVNAALVEGMSSGSMCWVLAVSDTTSAYPSKRKPYLLTTIARDSLSGLSIYVLMAFVLKLSLVNDGQDSIQIVARCELDDDLALVPANVHLHSRVKVIAQRTSQPRLLLAGCASCAWSPGR